MRLLEIEVYSKIGDFGKFLKNIMIRWSNMKKWVEWFVRMLVTCEFINARWC